MHEVLSVDEMVCKPRKNEATLAEALRLGQQIQESIRDNVGEWLTCSIGLGPDTFLAKVASDCKSRSVCRSSRRKIFRLGGVPVDADQASPWNSYFES
ncbi:MAG: hypothetical protein AB7H90_18225 [Alphaproteobacteria bacterium]